MTALTEFYDYVLPDLPRCDESIALLHIRLACEEFYRRSMVKRVTLADITTVADTAEYALILPDGYVADKAIHVWLDDMEIQPIGMDDRDSIASDWKTTTGEPGYYYLPDTSNIGMFLTPDAAYTVAVEAVLKPKSDATTIDEWVFETYREGISSGAKYRLMAMPKKPWSSDMAALHKTAFDHTVDTAMLAANRGHGRAPKRTRAVFGLR